MTDGDDLFGGATGARRSGQEVLRPAGPWTPAVHAVMRHVAATGVPETPEVLGVDESGDYERLRWIPGDDNGVGVGSDDDLWQVGQLVRRVHDSLLSFSPPPDASWRLRCDGPTFIHGDISPWNVVWREDRIVGLLDWDQAGPGRDLEDLAYAAWAWVPLEAPEDVPGHWHVRDPSLGAQQARLRLLVEAFGLSSHERSLFLSEIAYVQAVTAGRVAVGSTHGDDGMRNIWWNGARVGVFGASMKWLGSNWASFDEALTRA